MPENLENQVREVGVVCSKSKKEVYCLTGSYDYKTNFQNRKDIDIIYIDSPSLFGLIRQNPRIVEWKVEDILALEIKQETLQN